ncbi:hypothetical protein [Rhizobium sp. NLR22b]|uniref:hypothetical protein n=1 Tax=Rhizobium sp. NLR22b TaxID=2731115 RepID=UPI001C83984F|nr:hypothetical protein [Rhizobium sp. NLR22b]MBX5242848.1 hypothetical protein [Rhizobium sp. NLR22b]
MTSIYLKGLTMPRLPNAPQIKPSGTIYTVTSDFGAECDDQKAWSQFVAQLKPGDEVFVMAGGPQPSQAARAMAQAVWKKTGRYPVTAEATQFEGHKTPKEKIFSLVDGKPIHDQELPGFSKVRRSEWQQKIDEAVMSNKFSKLEIVIISPIFAKDEVYDVSRADTDPRLATSLKMLSKTAILQMIRKEGKLNAYNYTKSAPGLPEQFHEAAVQAGFTMTYVDGNTAKDNAFKISARQPNLPGVENSIGFYIENLQVPWVNMPGPTGTVPEPEQMHVTMLTPKGEYPCLFHMSGAYTYGFGRERLAKDICAITDTKEYERFSSKAEKELNRFDTEVLKSLYGEECNVSEIRKEMRTAMLDALNKYAEEKGVTGRFEDFESFFGAVNKKAEETKTKPVASPFTYIKDFTEILFRDNSRYKEITDRAQELADRAGPDGKSHVNEMAAIIKDYNAQAVSFDAVTLAASHTIHKDPQLIMHFTERDGVRVVNPDKISALRKSNPHLYETLVTGVRAEMTLDGTAMAYDDRELGLVKTGMLAWAGNRMEQLAGVGTTTSPVSLAGLSSGELRNLKRTASHSEQSADISDGPAPVRRRYSADATPSERRQFARPDSDRSGRDTP